MEDAERKQPQATRPVPEMLGFPPRVSRVGYTPGGAVRPPHPRREPPMQYEVRCACGNAHAVTGADAGSALPCACGRAVEVPALHELRTAAGEEVLSPAVRIHALLLDKKLPGTSECACCHRETNDLVHVTIECERVITKSGTSKGEWVGGCLLFGVIWAWVLFQSRPPIQRGQDVVLTVPLPLCERCRFELTSLPELRKALRHVPEYAALLDRYPNARITRAG